MCEKLLIWGIGNRSKCLLTKSGAMNHYDIIAFVDNKAGQEFFLDKPVITPDKMEGIEFDYLIITPYHCETIIEQIHREYPIYIKRIKDINWLYEREIKLKYEKTEDKDIQDALAYIYEHGLSFFLSDFQKKYYGSDVRVEYDNKCNLFYTYRNNKRLYFAKHLDSVDKVKNYYRCIMMEQDEKSPHKYLNENFDIEDGDVIVDCGGAEGFFSLDSLEKAKKIYIFETNPDWCEALKITFNAYEDKVRIVNREVSSITIGNSVALDDVIEDKVNFLKMDIEGHEWEGLVGAKDLIRNSPNLKLAICSYHRPFDERLIKQILNEYGVECNTTPGVVWFAGFYDSGESIEWYPTWLSRCVVQGRK